MKILRPEEVTEFPDFKTEWTPEQMKEAMALARAAFTIEDLLKFTDIVEEVPAEQILEEMEEALRKANQGTP
jgi:hypothetical protein